jgi:predicted nucleotide-binding protein
VGQREIPPFPDFKKQISERTGAAQEKCHNSRTDPFMKTVFIGSSKEAKDRYAEPIAHKLAEKLFTPIRWWTEEAFPAGKYIFEQLCELSKHVDAAIFIATGEDRTWYRQEHVLP